MKKFSSASPARTLAILAALAITPAVRAAEDHTVWTDLLLPALQNKCASCHGVEKQKGKLRVDSFAALLEGGSEGPSLVPGDLDESLMWFRVTLPLDDDEVMPPEDKTQLTETEKELLKLWILKGADQSMKLSQLGLPEALESGIEEILAANEAKPEEKVLTEDEKKALEAKAKLAEETMEKVNATGATLMPVAQNTPQLRFSALNVVDKFGDEQLKSLAPVADQIVWLDLARTQVTDKGLASIKGMENLTKLHLENTGVTDAGLVHIKGLKNLEYLNLYRTPVTDAGVAHLAGLQNLKRLYLWQSKATPRSVETLKKSVPAVVVNLGWEFEDKAKVVQVADAKPAAKPAEEKKPAPAPKAEEKKPAPAPKAEEKKPAATPKPAAKPAEKKPVPAPKAEEKKPEMKKPAPAPKVEEKKPEAKKPAAKPEAKKPEAKPAPKPETKKPEPAKPAPVPTLSSLEASLKADLDSANAMIANARKSADTAVTAAEQARKAAEEAMKQAEAKLKAAEAAKKNVADIEAVAAAIAEALKVAQSKQ